MDLLQEWARRLPPTAERPLAAINGELARGHLFRGEGQAAFDAVQVALQMAERLRQRGDDLVGFGRGSTLHLLITKAWALAMVRQPREGIALLYGVIALADAEEELGPRTRARFNLSSYVAGDDPRESLRIAREGFEICQQYGLAVQAAMTAGNAAGAAQSIGDLDVVFELERQVPASEGSLGTFIYGSAAVAAQMRGDSEGAERRLAVVEAVVAASTSAQDAAEWHATLSQVAFAKGDLRGARQHAKQSLELFVGGGYSVMFATAAHSALLTGDLEGLRADAEWYAANPDTGRWYQRTWRTVEAGMFALEGRLEEARTAYRRVIDEWRDADLPLDLAITLVERSIVLGDEDSEAAGAREEALRIFRAMGAEPMFERLESAARSPRAAAVGPGTELVEA
jgi:ATP/maltotriose-dependent transcriptional regulator MalT